MSDVLGKIDESPFCNELPPPSPDLKEEEDAELDFAGVELGIFKGFAEEVMTVTGNRAGWAKQANDACRGHILYLEGHMPFGATC